MLFCSVYKFFGGHVGVATVRSQEEADRLVCGVRALANSAKNPADRAKHVVKSAGFRNWKLTFRNLDGGS